MFKNILGQLGALWRHIERIGTEERTVLLVSVAPSMQFALRILAIQERWHILFAKNLNAALQLSRVNRINVVIYDCELPDLHWRDALHRLTESNVFFILLSPDPGKPLWKAVLDNGGYDVAPRDMVSEKLGRVVNSAFALSRSIDALAAHHEVVTPPASQRL